MAKIPQTVWQPNSGGRQVGREDRNVCKKWPDGDRRNCPHWLIITENTEQQELSAAPSGIASNEKYGRC